MFLVYPPLPKGKPENWTDEVWRWRTGTDRKICAFGYVWKYFIMKRFGNV